MSEQGSRALERDRFQTPKPVVDPFDSVALAARLAEARALRAVALAKREQQTLNPGQISPAARARSAGATARRPVESGPTEEPPSARGVLRADPDLRAVPARTGGLHRTAGAASLKPALAAPRRSRRPLGWAAFIAGCVAIGTAVLVRAPSIPQQVAELGPPAGVQVAAPSASAPLPTEALAGSPDPVPPLFAEPSEDRGLTPGPMTEAPARPPDAGPQPSAAPQRPPALFLQTPSVAVNEFPGEPPAPESRGTDLAETMSVPDLPAVSPVRSQTAAADDAPEGSVRPAWAAAAQISAYFPAGANDAAAAALGKIEDMIGFRPVASPVAHDVGRTNVRYYHAADLPAAREMATVLAAEARDFTDFRPQPEPGVIEIWLAGEASSSVPVVAAAQPQRAAPAPARSAARPEPDRRAGVNAVEQQRLELQVQRLLREQLREMRRR